MATAQKTKASGKGKAAHSAKSTVKPARKETKPPKPVAAKVGKTSIAKAKAALTKETREVAKVPRTATAAANAPVPKAKGRKISIDASSGETLTALAQKWATLYKKAEQIESKPYNMKAIFAEKTGLVHKILGWGYILANRNDRLEVLFKDGIKYLISNYKP